MEEEDDAITQTFPDLGNGYSFKGKNVSFRFENNTYELTLEGYSRKDESRITKVEVSITRGGVIHIHVFPNPDYLEDIMYSYKVTATLLKAYLFETKLNQVTWMRKKRTIMEDVERWINIRKKNASILKELNMKWELCSGRKEYFQESIPMNRLGGLVWFANEDQALLAVEKSSERQLARELFSSHAYNYLTRFTIERKYQDISFTLTPVKTDVAERLEELLRDEVIDEVVSKHANKDVGDRIKRFSKRS